MRVLSLSLTVGKIRAMTHVTLEASERNFCFTFGEKLGKYFAYVCLFDLETLGVFVLLTHRASRTDSVSVLVARERLVVD